MKEHPDENSPRDAGRRAETETGSRHRPESGWTRPVPTKAVVIAPVRVGPRGSRDPLPDGEPSPVRSPEARLAEAVGLAEAIELQVVRSFIVRLNDPRPATLFGTGKVDEIADIVATEGAELVVVDHALTPVQQRNLERAFKAKVVDRTALILEIFGARARTREGTLQVELAHLTWQKSRLVRTWTHLERQRGGFGFLGGPGETQIEADRRLIQERINRIEADLEDVKRTRALHRSQRKKVPHPVVALVGYTNAGKSTLFNRMTRAEVFAKDLLFATLDPTLRQIRLPHGGDAILSDTVGFISDLPTHLVAAFRATLEEVVEADLVLHVRDISHPETEAQAADVAETLRLLGLDARDRNRVVEVWNKVDLLPEERREKLLEASAREEGPIAVSALTGDGIERLLLRIERHIARDRRMVRLAVPVTEGRLLAWLHENTEVLERRDTDDAVWLSVRVPERAAEELVRKAGPFVRG